MTSNHSATIFDFIRSHYGENLLLHPPQLETLLAGLIDLNENLLISIPTATGKTLIAEIALLANYLKFPQSKAVYLSPLRALSSEKFQDFNYLRELGVRQILSTGDYDKQDLSWKSLDLLITTNEKFDSLIRSSTDEFYQNLGLIVVDEVHLLDDLTRGPTLETVLIKIGLLNPRIRIIALSATIKNAEEIAGWLKAVLIHSTWRAIPILEGLATQQGVLFWQDQKGQTKIHSHKDIIWDLAEETLKESGQVLIFGNSRKNTQKIAERLSHLSLSSLSAEERALLKKKLKKVAREETRDSKSTLVESLMLQGIAFHHAGLSSSHRSLIEELFKNRLLKIVTATPTLAAGINVPARRVIIASPWRYSETTGSMELIKVMEYEQMRGRSGRPKYDSRGETVLVTKDNDEFELCKKRYLAKKGYEGVTSKMATEPSLRMHILGILSSRVATNYLGVYDFVKRTLYAHQYRNDSSVENKVVRVVDFLVNSSLVSRASDESLRVTNLGKRVASLYVDPLTAQRLISGVLQSIGNDKFPAITEFSFLHLFATVPDMQRLRIKASDFDALEQMAKESEQTFLTEMPTSHDVRYERLLMEVQTARILVLWIEEADPQKILDSGRIDLGDLNRLIDTSNWIAYSCRSLARELRETARRSSDIKLTVLSTLDLDPQIILNRLHYLESFLESLEIRLKYGIRSDLTKLIQVKYIGRVRARALAEAGITFEDLPNCTLERLSTIRSIGSGIAKLILSQAVGPSDDDEEQYSAPTEVKRKAAFSMRKKRIEEFFN